MEREWFNSHAPEEKSFTAGSITGRGKKDNNSRYTCRYARANLTRPSLIFVNDGDGAEFSCVVTRNWNFSLIAEYP